MRNSVQLEHHIWITVPALQEGRAIQSAHVVDGSYEVSPTSQSSAATSSGVYHDFSR
jgi:hypothetical protein